MNNSRDNDKTHQSPKKFEELKKSSSPKNLNQTKNEPAPVKAQKPVELRKNNDNKITVPNKRISKLQKKDDKVAVKKVTFQEKILNKDYSVKKPIIKHPIISSQLPIHNTYRGLAPNNTIISSNKSTVKQNSNTKYNTPDLKSNTKQSLDPYDFFSNSKNYTTSNHSRDRSSHTKYNTPVTSHIKSAYTDSLLLGYPRPDMSNRKRWGDAKQSFKSTDFLDSSNQKSKSNHFSNLSSIKKDSNNNLFSSRNIKYDISSSNSSYNTR